MTLQHAESIPGKVALAFASALVSKDYDLAHGMLSASLQGKLTSAQLRTAYSRLVDYSSSRADFVGVMNTLDDWPARQPNDTGWAYVAISGEDFSEGIAVVVTEENDQPRIREIEWGRP